MRIQINTLALLCITALSIPMVSCNTNSRAPIETEDPTWQQTLGQDLNLLGHRNWILVVDKAFPEQSSPGMKYIYVEQDLIPTLAFVLNAVESSTHVKPLICRDQELAFITEEQVPGIETFRRESDALLKGREVLTLLHDDVFALLDESASLFRVLVIKTNCTMPYTSVFLQLDCAYWNSIQEKALRDIMAEAQAKAHQ